MKKMSTLTPQESQQTTRGQFSHAEEKQLKKRLIFDFRLTLLTSRTKNCPLLELIPSRVDPPFLFSFFVVQSFFIKLGPPYELWGDIARQ